MWNNTAIWLGKNSPRYANNKFSPEEIFESVVKALTPLKQPTTTKDVAAAVAFLLSDEACMITGQAINVDGGIELH